MGPTKLRILGVDTKIVFSKESYSSEIHGEYNPIECTIYIMKDQNIGMQKSALLHEIIEAINYRLELKLSHNKITSLETALIQVFLDNPDLVQYLGENNGK